MDILFHNTLHLIRFLCCLVPFSLFVLGCGREVRVCMGWVTVKEGFIVCYSFSVEWNFKTQSVIGVQDEIIKWRINFYLIQVTTWYHACCQAGPHILNPLS